MSKLWITLPAYAGDYSGVCSAMYELGGLAVIHDASGCTGNYTGYDEPRWYDAPARTFCSGLREIDAVLGDDDKLVGRVAAACEELRPTMIAVIGSPVPMVIGTDFKGIAAELETRTGLPCFGFPTNGIVRYGAGISAAQTALIGRFTKNAEKKVPRSVNILGMTPLDFADNGNAAELAAFLEGHGLKVNGRLMMGVSLEQIERLGEAALNLAVTQSGMDAAELLRRRYGAPWVAALPLCGGETALELIERTLADGQCRAHNTPSRDGGVLIVGEQVCADALRAELLERAAGLPVTVGTMLGLDRRLASPGDLDVADEAALRGLIESGRFRTIVGDPLFAGLIPPDSGVELVELPHPALSSKLYWDHAPRWLGTEMSRLVETILSKSKGA